MAMKVIFLEEFGKAFVPKKAIPHLRKYLLKAGFNEVPYKFFGSLFYVTALITTLIFIIFIYPYFKRFTLFEIYIYSFIGWFLVQMFFAILFILLIYFYLVKYFRNTFEKALWTAVKPRFNVLGSEMAKASKKVMTGDEISKALTELADKYDSLMLRRTVDLMISEVESGGNVAELIDRLVDNLKETKALKDEMSASAIAYVIFISVIVVVISPLLFALSFHLLILITSFIGQLSSATQRVSALPFVFSKVNLDPQDFKVFSIVSILVISFFSSLIVSIVEKGDVKGGIKYIPIYIFGAMALYTIFMKVLGALFAGII